MLVLYWLCPVWYTGHFFMYNCNIYSECTYNNYKPIHIIMKYFSVHVFYSRNDGFSIPVKIETSEEILGDEKVIDFAVESKLLDAEDANSVDTVDEIDENEYYLMIG
jgi:hypothetical protein